MGQATGPSGSGHRSLWHVGLTPIARWWLTPQSGIERVLQLLDSIAAPAMPYRALGVADAACHLIDLPLALTALLARPKPRRMATAAGNAADRVCDEALALLAAHSAAAPATDTRAGPHL